jgi:hypothetical protein
VDAAPSACDYDRLMLVRLVNAFWHLLIASENASVHFLTLVSLRLNLGLLDGAFVSCWPWSIVHVMGKWSEANESSLFTCQFLIIRLFEASALVNVKSMIDRF